MGGAQRFAHQHDPSANGMNHVAKADEHLYIYSMGKRFRVLGVFTTDTAANAYCATRDEAAVIACFGPFIFVASKYEGEVS